MLGLDLCLHRGPQTQLSQANIPSKTAATFAYDSSHNLTGNAATIQTADLNESRLTVRSATTAMRRLRF